MSAVADIALVLDSLEAMFDDRADTFCPGTSDSDCSPTRQASLVPMMRIEHFHGQTQRIRSRIALKTQHRLGGGSDQARKCVQDVVGFDKGNVSMGSVQDKKQRIDARKRPAGAIRVHEVIVPRWPALIDRCSRDDLATGRRRACRTSRR